MSNESSHEDGVRGVFSTMKKSWIGTGTTRRKVDVQVYVYAEQDGDSVRVQELNENYLPSGEESEVSLEEFLAGYTPDPEVYEKKMQPAVRKLTKTLAKAERQRQQGEVYSAEFEFKNALDMDGENVRANFGLGLTYLDRGDTKEAERVLKKLVNLAQTFSHDNKHLFNEFGIKLRKSGMYDQALAYYGRAMQIASQDENLFYNIARTLYDKGDMEKGLVFVDKALALRSGFNEAEQLKQVMEKKRAEGA